MTAYKKIGFDILAISEAFNIVKQKECTYLKDWTPMLGGVCTAGQSLLTLTPYFVSL